MKGEFSNVENLDAKIASALKKISPIHIFERKSVPKSSELKNTNDFYEEGTLSI